MKFQALKKISIIAILLAGTVATTSATKPTPGQRININAKRFSYQPNEITVKKGQPVTLVFHSQDVNHGFVSEEFHVRADIPKRSTAQVTFTPQEDGTFTGKCAHFCGAGHGQMQLTIHVTD
ncbi:MAG TPA: cupredoxin domain-containing protein [Terriglobales bacterium]